VDQQQRQWELNRLNFAGRWCGSSQWYLRGDELNLSQPTRVINNTCYHIHFSDPDNGIWDGRGLLFAPDGRRQLALNRDRYNSGGQCWQFMGAGGQSSLRVDAAAERFGHEVNLFAGRSRSMLVLLWGQHPQADGVSWSLDAVGAVGFRCSNAPSQEPPRPIQPPEQLLQSMQGWPGTRQCWPDERIDPCEPFSAEQFAIHPLTATFVDGLICSVPEHLHQGAFKLQIGCRTSADAFQQINLIFNEQQSLELCERRCYAPASIAGDG
jgi:hypothetical protein